MDPFIVFSLFIMSTPLGVHPPRDCTGDTAAVLSFELPHITGGAFGSAGMIPTLTKLVISPTLAPRLLAAFER